MIEGIKDRLVMREWVNFQQVHNEGGPASCQKDMDTFFIMRGSQFAPWSQELMESWYDDLAQAEGDGRNLLAEKYAWMMEHTDPEAFQNVRRLLKQPTEEALALIEEIVPLELKGMEGYRKKYPYLAQGNRSFYAVEDERYATSFETYLRGELHTYSERTLRLYQQMAEELDRQGSSVALVVMDSMVKAYGYSSLEEAERQCRLRAEGRV